MLVKTYYSTGHLDVFDTATLTDSSLFKGNVLTDYALEVADARGGRALWLDLFYYEAADAYKGDTNPHGLPVARRRDGWSCVLADEEDLKTLIKVSVDGEDVLLCQGDEFVDALMLKAASDAAWRTNPAAMATHDYYLAADDERDPCEAIGYSESAYERVATMQRRTSVPDNRQEDMEGADDENRFEDR